MTNNKRFFIYLGVLLWVSIITLLINIPVNQKNLGYNYGITMLAFQTLPLQILLSFYLLKKSIIKNILFGIALWYVCLELVTLIKTHSFTGTGDTVSGVALKVFIHSIIISFFWEMIYQIKKYYSK